MTNIEAIYEDLETSFEQWSQRMDAFVVRVGDDDRQRRRIDELKLKQRLARTMLGSLRTDAGRRWETTKVVITHVWRLYEFGADYLSKSMSDPAAERPTLVDATMARNVRG